MRTFAKHLSVGLVYTGGPFYGYVVQVHVVVLCACVHLYVDMLISSQPPTFIRKMEDTNYHYNNDHGRDSTLDFKGAKLSGPYVNSHQRKD